STRRIATAGFGNSIITKKIQIDQMKPEELQEQIYWEAEQYIPFDVNDVNLDFAILGNTPGTSVGKMDVLLVAAKKDYIQSLNDLFAEANLEVHAIDTQAFALGNAFEYNYSHLVNTETAKQVCVLVDFGAGSTKISLFESDKTLFNRELRQCGLSCSQMLAERLGVSLAEAEKLKIERSDDPAVAPLMDEFVSSLTEEVSRTIDFSLTQSADMAVDGVFVCGGAARTRGLVKSLESRLSAPVKRMNPIQFISGSGKKMSSAVVTEITQLGSLAVGLALRGGGK
ncbi:pilus assembly protein PilM, partial [bacterium]|nr:pilus assembly protein PilM [bacterium]